MPWRQRSLFPVIRKIHLYLGLFFLVELWVFAISGLILGHPQWQISQFWSRRAGRKDRQTNWSLAGSDL
jgi:hypothetical protein